MPSSYEHSRNHKRIRMAKQRPVYVFRSVCRVLGEKVLRHCSRLFPLVLHLLCSLPSALIRATSWDPPIRKRRCAGQTYPVLDSILRVPASSPSTVKSFLRSNSTPASAW